MLKGLGGIRCTNWRLNRRFSAVELAELRVFFLLNKKYECPIILIKVG